MGQAEGEAAGETVGEATGEAAREAAGEAAGGSAGESAGEAGGEHRQANAANCTFESESLCENKKSIAKRKLSTRLLKRILVRE